MSSRILCGTGLMAIMALAWGGEVAASGIVASAAAAITDLDFSLLATCLVFLIPAGLIMMAVGASEVEGAPTVAVVGLIAMALGVIGYALLGFGFQFGGLGLVSDLRGASELVSEWSPVDRAWGPGWGIIGLDGFLVLRETQDANLLTLFLYQAALAATAVCIPLLALARRLRLLALLGLGLIFAALVYPIYGNWVWGGGWLSQLGTTLGLGHGFIDFAGSGTIHALSGFFALAGILVFGGRFQKSENAAAPPPIHFPLLALLGALLLLPGWFGLVAGNPLLTGNVSQVRIVVNILLAACGGILVGTLYIWFAAGYPDLLMVARSMVASLVAISASCAFVPPWAALVIGALAGLLVPLSIYLFEVRLGLDDPTSGIAVHGMSGLWGLTALGIFADGASGQGWNGVGTGDYLTIAGQGVSGLLVRSGFQPDWPQQTYAQIAGVVALLLLGLALSWLVFRVLNGFVGRVAGLRSQITASGGRASGDE